MKVSKGTLVLLSFLVLTNVAWAYASLDRGVTLAHQSDELAMREKLSELLASLVTELPRQGAVQEVRRFLQSRYPDEVVKLDGDTIEIGAIALEYRDGKLVRVKPFCSAGLLPGQASESSARQEFSLRYANLGGAPRASSRHAGRGSPALTNALNSVPAMTEILFIVQEAEEGGYTAHAVDASIVTEAETLDELRANAREAVRCHFDDGDAERPKLIRLHLVRDEVIAA
jgi:predicted RNase H-like HicB family nuclease